MPLLQMRILPRPPLNQTTISSHKCEWFPLYSVRRCQITGKHPSRLLVVRNDKLGDFMLAWPGLAILKYYWPEVRISALVPNYTREMAQLCPWIDEVIVDDGQNAWQLARKLSASNFDAMLILYSTCRVALAGALAKIPYRLAPASKVFQFLYNHRMVQRRSRSLKPEYAYNIDIAHRLLNDLLGKNLVETAPNTEGDYLPPVITRPLLRLNNSNNKQLREQLFQDHAKSSPTHLVFIHPGSGGSANNLSLEQFATLANALQSSIPLRIVISAGPDEGNIAKRLASKITTHPVTLLPIKTGLMDLCKYLQIADLFISGSTGPLHIAAALDRPTAAFYPRHRSGSPLRWQTLNTPHKRLFFIPPHDADAKDVSSIDILYAAHKISTELLK